MQNRSYRSFCFFSGIIILVLIFYFWLIPASHVIAAPFAQIPTGSIPTVTSTPTAATAYVLDNEQGYVNVRAGPSSVYFEIVGVLVEKTTVPALGRSPGGDWILIAYPGVPGGVAWVWSDLVEIKGVLSVVEPPPTPTLRLTPTIDPTLAAQFLVEIPATRLPTFSPAPTMLPATPVIVQPQAVTERLPIGLVIIALAVVGIFGTLISILQGR